MFLFAHVSGVLGALALPGISATPIRPSAATTAAAFTCNSTVANSVKQSTQLKQNDTFTIDLAGSGCNYVYGPAKSNSILRITDQNNNVVTSSTLSLAGITSLTVTALHATPVSTYLRFSTQIGSADNANEHATFPLRVLAGGADIQRLTFSTTGLLGQSTLFYNGDYSLESTSYIETASTITVTMSASSIVAQRIRLIPLALSVPRQLSWSG